MIVSNQRQALCQRRAGGSLSPSGPDFCPTNTISTALHGKTQASTGTSQDQPIPPPHTHTHLTLLTQALLTDPPESEGIQDKWLRGWS